MCSSDKQNMEIDNVALKGLSSFKDWVKKLTNAIRGNDIEKNRTELKNLVEKAWGVIDKGERLNSAFIGKLIEAENYGDAIDYSFQKNLVPGLRPDLKRIKNHLDKLFQQLDSLISKPSTNQSSSHQLGNVRRYLLLLCCFDLDFVFNLKRVTRLSVTKEDLREFLEIIGEDSNHFLLNANGRNNIKTEWDSLYTIPCFEGINCEQIKDYCTFRIFKAGTNITDPLEFEKLEFMLLRYLSLRGVNLTNGQNLNLNKLSSLKYLDLKHTNVENCRWFQGLEKLQMLDLRYTNVKKISDDDLEKLGKLQHLLLGYIDQSKKNGKNQLVGPKLIKVQKLKMTNLKTLRAIEQSENIKEIRHFSNVVDLSVTGLTKESLPTFWGTLEEFHNLTSLGVAVTGLAVIKLEDCKDELKNKLKRLRMEGSHSGLEKLCEFGKLNDLTLANMDIRTIPGLPELLCLRLYGVCQEATCKIELKWFPKLKKFVIGDMGEVKTVQIARSAVLERVVTLKFSNLPLLEKVTDANKKALFSGEVNPNKTIFLRHVGDFHIQNSRGLKIYHYDKNKQCYELKATQNKKG